MITSSVTAGTASGQVEIYKKALSSVPKLEMPAKAALEVKNAKTNKKQAAMEVLQAAISIAPASAPAVVRAISRVVPELGSELATLAANLQPQQSLAIQAAVVPMAGRSSMGEGAIIPAGGPTLGVPFIPGPVGQLRRHTVVVVTPGEGRKYSAP